MHVFTDTFDQLNASLPDKSKMSLKILLTTLFCTACIEDLRNKCTGGSCLT